MGKVCSGVMTQTPFSIHGNGSTFMLKNCLQIYGLENGNLHNVTAFKYSKSNDNKRMPKYRPDANKNYNKK